MDLSEFNYKKQGISFDPKNAKEILEALSDE
jgi:hypothetical protein